MITDENELCSFHNFHRLSIGVVKKFKIKIVITNLSMLNIYYVRKMRMLSIMVIRLKTMCKMS